MNLRRIVAGILGGILAVVGLMFAIQHMGLNWELLIGLAVMIIGVWILLGLPITV